MFWCSLKHPHAQNNSLSLSFETSLLLFDKNHTCVGITTDYMKFHVCGKNHTGVVFTKYLRPVNVCGRNHTGVVFTKYLRPVDMFGKNHTCVWKSTHVCVFPNTGWYFLYLYLYLTNIIQISYLLHISIISGAATQNHNMGTRTKWTLYFRCVGIPTHIKHQNNNNNIKTITLHMSPPPKIWGKPFSFQGYFHFYCKMSRLKNTTLKPIYGFWANGGLMQACK